MIMMMSSCFKEEPLSMECDIQGAVVRLADPTKVFYNASDSAAVITQDYLSSEIVFNNVLPGADLSNLAPIFTITPGATITPASGTVRDFSKGAQTYTVTSEDGSRSRKYSVRFASPFKCYNYGFEKYFLANKDGQPDEKGKFYVWTDMPAGETPNWCSANAGFGIAKSSAKPWEYTTTPEITGYEGACVKLVTTDTGVWGATTGRPLAAGNLFLGTFDMSKALTKTLQSTRFGLPVADKPLRFQGYYKYKPGAQMQDKAGNPIPGTDTGAVYAVFYKNHDAEGNPMVLTGEDVLTNPNIVAIAKNPVLRNNTDWVYFDLEFKYTEEVDKELLSKMGYSLAIVCSSSKDGDVYVGALGSTLWVDSFAVIVE